MMSMTFLVLAAAAVVDVVDPHFFHNMANQNPKVQTVVCIVIRGYGRLYVWPQGSFAIGWCPKC